MVDPEQEAAKRKISWEIIDPQRLHQLLNSTIEETLIQQLSAASWVVNSPNPLQHLSIISSSVSESISQLRAIQKMLKQDPNTPIPIDHKYENASGDLIIALDLVGTNPPQP